MTEVVTRCHAAPAGSKSGEDGEKRQRHEPIFHGHMSKDNDAEKLSAASGIAAVNAVLTTTTRRGR